jgi:hypothetical protein
VDLRSKFSRRSWHFAAEGWQLRHSLPWQGRGDIDTVAIAPTGLAFAIETKTRTYTQSTSPACATSPPADRRPTTLVSQGALPVPCVVSDRELERVEANLLVVSIDRPPAR